MEIKKVFIEEHDDFLLFNIWVTLYCNFRCRYCYESSNKPSSYMNEETADAAVSFMVDMLNKTGSNALWINFHGGEPMLNTNIIKHIIKRINEETDVNILTSMTTNCSLWDDEICDSIQEISVSIDGNKDVHDSNRVKNDGSGTYDSIIGNALRFLNRKKNVRLRMVVTPNNVHKLYDGIVHLLSLGFKEIIPGIDYFDNNWNQEHFEILYDQLNKVKRYRKWHFSKKCVIGILDEGLHEKGQCIVGEDGYQISVDGKLYPCSYVVNRAEFCIGDIRNGIDKLAVEKINCLNHKTNIVCEGCSNYKYCISPRCLMINKILTDDFYTPSAVICAAENVKLRLRGMF